MKDLKLNQQQIKLFMAMLMVTDHIDHVPNLIPDTLAMIFHILSRCVGVWFAYSAVEGVFYTHDIKRYLLRLYVAAGIMFTGSKVLELLFASKQIIIPNNIFLTLAFGVTMLAALKYIQNKPLAYFCAFFAWTMGNLFGDGGTIVLPFMLITYLTYNRFKLRNSLYLIYAVILFIASYAPYETLSQTLFMLMYNCDFMFILIFPFLYVYNGERGSNTKFSKYFFYVFYPVHLWLLATLAYLMS